MTSPEEAAENVQRGVKAIILDTAKTLAALSLIGGAVWFFARPQVGDYLERWSQPTVDRLAAVERSLTRIEGLLEVMRPRPVVEFFGSGVVVADGPYLPGQAVEILYLLQRNSPCPVTVQARFISAQKGRVDTSLSYSIPATQAPITLSPQPFVVSVRIPSGASSGRYSYAPVLAPDRSVCPEAREMHVPPSEFFTVGGS